MNKYWRDEHEQAVKDYQQADDIQRQIIYTKKLHPALSYMARVIYERYFLCKNFKLTSYRDDHIQLAMITAYKALLKFNIENGATAYSYLQTVIKNTYNTEVKLISQLKTKYVVESDEPLPDLEDEEYEHVDERDTFLKLMFLLKQKLQEVKRSNSQEYYVLKTVIDIVDRVGKVNKNLNTYYLLSTTGLMYYQIKNALGKYGLGKLIYQNPKLNLDFYHLILKDYSAVVEQFNDYNYLYTVFEKYEKDKKQTRDTIRDQKKKVKNLRSGIRSIV